MTPPRLSLLARSRICCPTTFHRQFRISDVPARERIVSQGLPGPPQTSHSYINRETFVSFGNSTRRQRQLQSTMTRRSLRSMPISLVEGRHRMPTGQPTRIKVSHPNPHIVLTFANSDYSKGIWGAGSCQSVSLESSVTNSYFRTIRSDQMLKLSMISFNLFLQQAIQSESSFVHYNHSVDGVKSGNTGECQGC